MRTSLVEYGDILILIGNFPKNAKITVSNLKYRPITVKLTIFIGRQKIAVKKRNHNSWPKNTFKRCINTNLLGPNVLPAQFLLFCTYKLFKFKMAAKLLTNRVFDHNFQITQTGKDDFTKPVDHRCV